LFAQDVGSIILDIKLITIGCIFIFIILGIVKQLLEKNNCGKTHSDLLSFHNLLVKYIEEHGHNFADYVFLQKQSTHVQDLLGGNGFVTLMLPFHHDMPINHFPIITGGLDQLQQYIKDNALYRQTNQIAEQMISMLLRTSGIFERKSQQITKSLKNPIISFAIGLRLIITSPFYIFYWFGLFDRFKLQRIEESFIIKSFSFLITLIGLISSIMSILLGWDQIIAFIRRIF
jgi:hypothetical protein